MKIRGSEGKEKVGGRVERKWREMVNSVAVAIMGRYNNFPKHLNLQKCFECIEFLCTDLCSLLMRDAEISAYIWIYDNYCIYALHWNSPWTWLLSMIGVDFCYYWVHRCAHGLRINHFNLARSVLGKLADRAIYFACDYFFSNDCSEAQLSQDLPN